MPCASNPSASIPYPIAIDGTAASGKSALGAALAQRYRFQLLDTGVTYRAFTVVAVEGGVPADDEDACVALAKSIDMRVEGGEHNRVWIGDREVTGRLRDADVEATVSDYSAIADVRRVMIALQREIAGAAPSVLVGRDIGTVVLPDAPVKFFLTASEDERAKRRALQAGTWGRDQHADDASGDISRRDEIDSTRGGLSKAPDAVQIDTSHMTLDEVIAHAIEVIECRR